MARLIWVCTGHTGHFVGFVIHISINLQLWVCIFVSLTLDRGDAPFFHTNIYLLVLVTRPLLIHNDWGTSCDGGVHLQYILWKKGFIDLKLNTNSGNKHLFQSELHELCNATIPDRQWLVNQLSLPPSSYNIGFHKAMTQNNCFVKRSHNMTIIQCHFDRALCKQTERHVKFKFTTDFITIAETSSDFICVIIAADVDKINKIADHRFRC